MGNDLRALKAMTAIMNPSAVKEPIFKGVKMPYVRKKEVKPRKSYKHDEQDLSRVIQADLKLLEFHKRIIHWDRYNSGLIQTALGYWLKLCRKGTADLMFMLPGRLNIYIETKAKTRQSAEQKEFQDKVERAGHKYYIVKDFERWEKIKEMNLYVKEM